MILDNEFEWSDELDLLDMLHILRRRWWVIIVCFILAVIICAVVTYNFIVPLYKAETTLFAGKEPSKIASLDISDLNLNQRLVTDYREIVLSRLVARQVIEELDLDMTVMTFQRRVTVEAVRDSRFFKIAFESTSPKMAMDVANALGRAIIEKAADIIDVQNVIVIDAAELPTKPIKPNKTLNIAIAALLGLMFGVFLVYFLELLDRTVKTDKDVQRHLALSTIGEIPLFEGEDRSSKKGVARIIKRSLWRLNPNSKGTDSANTSKSLISLLDPKAPASEAYRSLRTNIGYTSVDKQVQTIVITSAGPEEGKTTTLVNLAISLAQLGKKVLVIDADLRKARIHKYFSLPNDNGVTDIIVNKYKVKDAVKKIEEVDNLYVITSGAYPPNPAEILESKKMADLLETVRTDYDIILIDTPPVGQLTDAAILGKMADGVILVIASGETHIDFAKHAKSRLEKVNARVLGAVITKINGAAGGTYYYRYYNYNQYYYSD